MALVTAKEDYPVDFDSAWQWLEYSRKDNAKTAFLKMDFVESVDYISLNLKESAPGGGLTHRPA